MAGRQQDWASSVLERRPRIAVFDCDGTLWSGDAGFGFMRWSLEQQLVSTQARAWLLGRYDEYRDGRVDEATMCGEMVQVYAGLREEEMRKAANLFFVEHMEPLIFPELTALIEGLHAAGTEIWAVSSTCEWVIQAGVMDRFKIPAERILAARVRVDHGTVTDKLLAVPTDAAKAEALCEVDVRHPDAVFGNSIHDLAMLQIARDAYPVNPTDVLEQEARISGWPVFWPAGTRERLPT